MASTSVWFGILDGLRTLVRAASLADIPEERVKVRMLPKVGEVLDPLPCVLLVPQGSAKSAPLDFEGNAGREYRVEICLVDGIEGDFATNQEKYQTWLEQVVNKVEKQDDGMWRCDLADVPSVWGIEIDQAPTFDRSKLDENYSYQSVVVTVKSHE